MSYTWITYSTATGALGAHSQTLSPMIQATTVTVGSGTPTTKTTSTTTPTASTTTTYANNAQVTLEGVAGALITNYAIKDANGNQWAIPNVTIGENGTTTTTATCEVTTAAISVTASEVWTIVAPNANVTGMTNAASTTTETVVTIAFDPNLIHTGQAIIGPFDGKTVIMSADEQAAYANPQAYLYQSGAFVANSAYPAMQLAQAQQTQITAIEAGMNATLTGGFTSSANGTAIVYGYAAGDIQHMQGIATASLLNVETWPIAYANIEGTEVALTQAQFTQLVTDANTFNWAQIKQARTLIANIEAATTVADVQAVVWQAATY